MEIVIALPVIFNRYQYDIDVLQKNQRLLTIRVRSDLWTRSAMAWDREKRSLVF